jgi:hypothetical protein
VNGPEIGPGLAFQRAAHWLSPPPGWLCNNAVCGAASNQQVVHVNSMILRRIDADYTTVGSMHMYPPARQRKQSQRRQAVKLTDVGSWSTAGSQSLRKSVK